MNNIFEKTIDGMLSADWRERLKAEHLQSSIRITNLLNALLTVEDMPKEIRDELEEQLEVSKPYHEVLEKRCKKHGLI